jgi:hypothetical protein
VNLVARQKSGANRNQLLADVARTWVAQDSEAVATWIKTLPAEDRRGAVVAAVTSLLPFDPAAARSLARELNLNDESLRKLLSSTQH